MEEEDGAASQGPTIWSLVMQAENPSGYRFPICLNILQASALHYHNSDDDIQNETAPLPPIARPSLYDRRHCSARRCESDDPTRGFSLGPDK
ncbi:hypothetical protein OS493_028492 [Desmophyllum pertusum]|uniref:Uncharacterized protein n=1 Tax=Desmophyllum pertusum TaxID=174260 RepID=A0A9W9ZAN3_9CNID|nr:hypothetical protein OS493_028492 [Desmophyllum pertusum]